MWLCLPCSSWTNKLIASKDHGAVQINIGHLNEEGVYITGQFSTFALVGAVRAQVGKQRKCSECSQAIDQRPPTPVMPAGNAAWEAMALCSTLSLRFRCCNIASAALSVHKTKSFGIEQHHRHGALHVCSAYRVPVIVWHSPVIFPCSPCAKHPCVSAYRARATLPSTSCGRSGGRRLASRRPPQWDAMRL